MRGLFITFLEAGKGFKIKLSFQFMKDRAFLVEAGISDRKRPGAAVQLQFDSGKYLMISEYSPLSKLIINLADVSLYSEDAKDLLATYDESERLVSISYDYRCYVENREAWGQSRPKMYTSEWYKHVREVELFNSSMITLCSNIERELKRFRTGSLPFTERLEPKGKGKTTFTYDITSNIRFLDFTKETLDSVVGAGTYKFEGGDIILSSHMPGGRRVMHYELPEIDSTFAKKAGWRNIKYQKEPLINDLKSR
jgi:hypothetical protein